MKIFGWNNELILKGAISIRIYVNFSNMVQNLTVQVQNEKNCSSVATQVKMTLGFLCLNRLYRTSTSRKMW